VNTSAAALPSPTTAQRWRGRLPGLLLTGAVAAAAMGLAPLPWLQAHGISALTLAIVLGIALGNTLYPRLAVHAGAGVGFSKHWLLRAGIVLYGLRLTFQDIGQVGISGVLIDALVLTSTFALAWWAGTRWFGLDQQSALLIGAGSSICGAAAVMAAEPVVRGRAEQVTVAVSTVVVFGTLAMFVYPLLYQLNQAHGWIPMSAQVYGVFTGSTVHEVAQVVAAGRAVVRRGCPASAPGSWCPGSRSASAPWPGSIRCRCCRPPSSVRRSIWTPCCWRWRWPRSV